MFMISNIFNQKSIYEDDEDVLLFWQKKIFNCLFISLIIIGVIPYVMSCSYAMETSSVFRIVFYTLIYLWAIGVTFLKQIPFRIRTWAGISGFYVMGLFALLSTGFVSSARLYFMFFAIFAAVFSGIRGGVVALVMNITTLVGLGLLHFAGLLPIGQVAWHPDPSEWAVLVGTFFFLCAAATLSLAVLIKALEISGKEFKHLIKNTPDIIWTLDKNHIITFINSAVMTMLGYTQKELIGKHLSHLFSDRKIKFFRDDVKDRDHFNYETVAFHKNGTPIHVEVGGLKINDFSGCQNMYQGVIKDISRRRQEEEKQKQLEERLFQAEKFKAIGILAGGVAHDLNNILSGISTYPEVLMMDPHLSPKNRQGLSVIRDAGQKAAAVVSDLLTISRGARSDMDIININAVLERYIQSHDFRKLKDAFCHVNIEFSTDPELLNIKGSYIHIEKILMNLLLNAVEEVSTKADGSVMIATSNTFVDPSVSGREKMKQGEYVLLSVMDNGAGIDDDSLKKLFDPFFTKKKLGRSGTGLGLTVVWNAVQEHDGYITVASGPKGTEFELFFPAVRQAVPRKDLIGSLEDIRGNGETILVVDDLKDQQKIALCILENLGYRAWAVSDGYEAVAFIKETPVDLIILDMIMAPSISGLETYRLIKKIRPGQKAIIASGYSESDDVLMTQDLGAGSFVKKPYTILDMGIAVKEELEK